MVEVGDPSLNYTTTAGTDPAGFQLVVDFDRDGTGDGILVGEPAFYGAQLVARTTPPTRSVKALAPHTGGGFGTP